MLRAGPAPSSVRMDRAPCAQSIEELSVEQLPSGGTECMLYCSNVYGTGVVN